MSIMYGFINLDGHPAEPTILENMGATLASYKADKKTTLVEGNCALGFYNQYLTTESHFDRLPYYNEADGLFFICDAILDNREELASLLSLRLTNETPDSLLLYEAYKKWGKSCTRFLLGDFAFAIYDKKSRTTHLIRDHVGLRLLYYRCDGHRLFFSTLIKPLVNPWGDGRKTALDEKYLVHFLCMNDLRQELYAGSTIYQDISYVLPASCVTITEQAVSKEVYWDPLAIRPDRRLKKSDYIQEFKDIYTNAIRCRLRCDGEVGVMLSGGLDSSSVACVAASILQEQNKQLHTYTSVPLDGFTNWTPRRYNADESALVKIMQAAYPNMSTHFIDSEGQNSLLVADRLLDVYEQPYKCIENSYWMDGIYQASNRDGCKVVLGGFIGNSTVSYGNFQNILFEHFMSLRWFRFVQDFNTYCRGKNVSRKKIFKSFMGNFYRSVFNLDKSPVASGAVRREYLELHDVKQSLRSYSVTEKPLIRDKYIRRTFFNPTLLNQAYNFHSKSGLSAGVCDRDPTGDKRVIEFCMRLPYDFYFEKTTGRDRSLVRRAMSGIVPDDILNNKYRGLQAADWLERLVPQWQNFISDLSVELKQTNHLYDYLDIGLIKDLVKRNEELTFSFDTSSDVRNIIIIDNCRKFVNML